MKTSPLSLLVLAGLIFAAPLRAQEKETAPAKEPAAGKEAATVKEGSGTAELHTKFKEMMSGVVMSGRWCSLKDGVLGEEKDDRYDIVNVEKATGDDWTFHARLKRGDRDFVVPLTVQVKWAGDTAVIIVNDLKMPGGNAYGGTAYSARVLVYDKTYAGTWSGGDHGGLLKGVITKAPAPKPETK
jgi:hypothetical protein